MAQVRTGRAGWGRSVFTSNKSKAHRSDVLSRAALEALEGRIVLSAAVAPHVSTEMDFGDAPDSYSTLLASNGPRHAGPSGLFLGTRWDAENDGHPSTAANGDDLDPAGQADDEDGVTLPSPTPGTTGTVSVVASAAGKLDAFVDFNGDGDFADAGEKVFDSVSVVAGNNTLNYPVPMLSKSGKVYARFRISSAGGLSYNGPADDGEVEDYQFTIKPLYDFGDAPDSYGTTIANNGPQHALSPLYLGTRIDNESDGQPSDDATGDDFGPLGQPSDEDGVNLPTLTVGQDVTVSVVSSGAGKIDAWVDFNADGQFDSYYDGEKVLDNVPVDAGNNQLTIHVPENVGAETSFARFRLSSKGGLNSGGTAADGEVEDYQVTFDFGQDFGDAPDSYHTLLASDGPRHQLGSNIRLGNYYDSSPDAEPDGQPSADATGDDNNGYDDEGDVYVPAMIPGQECTLQLEGTEGAYVDAFIDFNGNGKFDASEKIIDSKPITDYSDTEFTFTVPADAVIGKTYARFRVSSAGGLGATGAAPDGEVEDYAVNIIANLDFGDAPDSYQTLLASDGPRHHISDLYLGSSFDGGPDAEADGQPNSDATGDDYNSQDDEGGVRFEDLAVGAEAAITVTASKAGKLDAFLDLNGDGDFLDAGEKIIDSADVDAGDNIFLYNVPLDAFTTDITYARFRISSAGGLGVGGEAADGEVEDYSVHISPLPSDIAVAKLTAPATVKPNGTITYVLTVDNLGDGDAQNVEITGRYSNGLTFVSETHPAGWTPFLPDPDFHDNIYFDRSTFAHDEAAQTFTVTFHVDPDVAVGTELSSTFSLYTDSDDTNSANDQMSALTTVSNSAPPTGVSISVVTDPADSSKKALKIVGTSSADKIEVLKSGSSQGKAVVKINGSTKGTFSFSGHVVVYGSGGNDTINVDTAITRGALIFGEAGNDTINAGGGDDVVIGGSGNDKLFGRAGRDLLFGGTGADSLSGGDGDDILLAGKSSFDDDIPSLAKLQKEWSRTDKNYTARVNDIKNGGGLNGSAKITKATADSTIASVDSLKGDAGSDLFFANLLAASGKPKDLLQDKAGSETSVDLD